MAVAEDAPRAPQVPSVTTGGGAARTTVERLMATYGDELYRYCVMMVGVDAAASMLTTIFAHAHEHLGAAFDGTAERVLLYRVAHNRCIDLGRGQPSPRMSPGGEPSAEEDEGASEATDASADAERQALEAVAELRPMGRNAIALGSLMGFGWDEQATIVGVPRHRMMRRAHRAWRRALFWLEPDAQGPGPVERPAGAPLSMDPEAWAPIRAYGRRYAALRDTLRTALARLHPPSGWTEEVWLVEPRARAERERRARERAEAAAQRAAEEAAEVERRAHEAAQQARRAKEAAEAEARAAEAEAERRRAQAASRTRRRIVLLALLAALVGVWWLAR